MGTDHRRIIGWAGVAVLSVAVGLCLLALGGSPGGMDASSQSDPPTALEEKAERVEERLAEHPGDPALQRSTMQAWIEAGNQRLFDLDTATEPIPHVVPEDFEAGLRAWERYIRQTNGEADAELAEDAGDTYFRLLEIGSRDLAEIEANAAGAAKALRIAGSNSPDLFTLSNEAIYEYFNGELAAGERAARGAIADAPSKTVDIVKRQFAGYRERGEFFRRQLRQAAAELQETGEELLAERLKAYRDAVSVNKDDPGLSER